MKKIYLILLLIPFYAQSQTVNLSNNNSKSINPRIVTNRSISYVFWKDNDNGNFGIRFRLYAKGSWSNVKKIDGSNNIYLSSICNEDSTCLNVLWIDGVGKNNRLMYGRIVDSTLIDSIEIFRNDTSDVIFSSCIFDQATETLHLSWDVSAGNSICTYYSFKAKSSNWSEKQIIINSIGFGNPRAQIVKDKNQNILCLWFFADSMSIHIIRRSANEWIEGARLTCEEGIGQGFVACNDDSSNILIVSLPVIVPTCPCNGLLYSKWNGSQWSTVEVVPRNEGHSDYTTQLCPNICFSKDNYPVIAWEQNGYDMYLNPYGSIIGTAVKTNLGWHINTIIAKHPNTDNPNISIDDQDIINYVWQDSSDGDYDIYFYRTSLLTSVKSDNNSIIPDRISLFQNYPNPFNSTTNISFNLPARSFVSLKVFDLIGREVTTIFSGELSGGSYTKQWNAPNMSSGIYFYRLQVGSSTETKNLILLK
jgi:hypothetical protein